jgi:hypothetical protein
VVVSSPFAPPRQRQNDAAKAPPVRAKPRLLSRHPLVGFGWRRELRRRRGIKLRQRPAKRIKARGMGKPILVDGTPNCCGNDSVLVVVRSIIGMARYNWPTFVQQGEGRQCPETATVVVSDLVILPCRSSARHAASAAVTMWRGSWRSMATPSCPICCRRSPIGRRRGPSASMIGARWSMRGLRRARRVQEHSRRAHVSWR